MELLQNDQTIQSLDDELLPDTIQLKSADGIIFEILKTDVYLSAVVKNFLVSDKTATIIDLNVHKNILAKIVEYLK